MRIEATIGTTVMPARRAPRACLAAVPGTLARLARVPRSESTIGVAAALTAAALWGGGLAMTRLGVSGGAMLGPADIVMLRFVGPALLLLPVLIRALPRLRPVPPLTLLAILVGGGAPFVLVAGNGLHIVGTAEAGALLPGTVPLCVAVGAALLGERPGRRTVLGLGLIALTVALMAGPGIIAGRTDLWQGHALLVGAAALSAIYTVALRRAGFGAWTAAAFLSVGTVVCFGPIYLLVLEPRVFAAPTADVLLQMGYQGVVSGIAAPVAFAAAVRRLGAGRAAAFGGLTPAAAALGGLCLLGEVPDVPTMLGAVAACCGVVLVSQQRGARPPA